MAAKIVTELPVFRFPDAQYPVYQIAPHATALEIEDLFDAKLAHLDALLNTVCGQGGESFRNSSVELQDIYIGGACLMVTEIKELARQLSARRIR